MAIARSTVDVGNITLTRNISVPVGTGQITALDEEAKIGYTFAAKIPEADLIAIKDASEVYLTILFTVVNTANSAVTKAHSVLQDVTSQATADETTKDTAINMTGYYLPSLDNDIANDEASTVTVTGGYFSYGDFTTV